VLDEIKRPTRDADQSALNITSPRVIVVTPPGPIIVCRVIVTTIGTSGFLTINDAPSLEAASSTNEIYRIHRANLAQGEPIVLFYRCEDGVVVSSVPKGGRVILSYYIAERRPMRFLH
jgi:hypothetical protein